MARHGVEVDERTVVVDHAAGNYAYKVMGWLLVADLALRVLRPGWVTWNGYPLDTLAVLCAGCLTWSVIAWRNRIVSRGHLRRLLLAALAGVAVAAAMILLLHYRVLG